VGSHTIAAAYSGVTNYAASSGSLTQQVNSAATTTTAVSSLNPSRVGDSVTYTATVAPTPDGGTIAFTDNATTLTGCGAVVVSTVTGKATCTTSYSAVGSRTIAAAYSGVTNYAASSGSLTQTVSSLISCPTSASVPAPGTAASTSQYALQNSDGNTWQEIDASKLRLSCAPSASQSILLTANADLWTANAGYNQDLGIFVSVNGGADQLVAWKESGGFAGTFSPNAAFVQSVYAVSAGSTCVFKLKWKTNKNAPGATIYAGAGPIGGLYSPTSLMAYTSPTTPSFGVSTTQYTLSNSDGVTWQLIDANLNTTLSPNVNATAVLGANIDLWTANAGYNQDIGIFVSDSGGVDTLVAWKESGGSAGTFSPNAAFVKATHAMTAGHSYTFKLKWKTNRPALGATIFAAAGRPSAFSQTSLFAETIATGLNPYSAVSTKQYSLSNSDGVAWLVIDPALDVTVVPGVDIRAVLGANADLWTANSGYNQDLGIFVSDNGGPDLMVAWKESGGSAGTFSPNAAFVQAGYSMTAGHVYVFKLKWKTNIAAPGTTIYAAAGGPPPYSPTRLLVELSD
jgi:hypothetical protein